MTDVRRPARRRPAARNPDDPSGFHEIVAPPAPVELPPAPLDDDPRVVAGLERFLDAILSRRSRPGR